MSAAFEPAPLWEPDHVASDRAYSVAEWLVGSVCDVVGWVRLASVLLALAVLVAVPASAPAAQAVEQQLADNYSPVLVLEPQQRACGPGEAYRPTSVDIVLGRQDVSLRDERGSL